MANANNNPCANFAQSKFHLELSIFLDHIKKTYPSEQERINDLTVKLSIFENHRDLISLDDLDNLNENLAKAKALSVVALSEGNFAELDTKTIGDYLWALEDLLTNAQKVIVQKNP